MPTETLSDQRYAIVGKSNDLIQRSRFNLSLQQQKILLFLISKIKPGDEDFVLYEFSISDFCRVCGINVSGNNYADMKRQIKEIADKSMWIWVDEKTETLVRWIEKPYIDVKSGLVRIKLDADLKPYLLNLKQNFTQYELVYTLRFQSKYSVRLYELVKSIHYHEQESYTRRYPLPELQKLMDAENYTVYADFYRRALKPAIDEINAYTDKNVKATPIRTGRKYTHIELIISSKPQKEQIIIGNDTDKPLGGVDTPTIYDRMLSEWN